MKDGEADPVFSGYRTHFIDSVLHVAYLDPRLAAAVMEWLYRWEDVAEKQTDAAGALAAWVKRHRPPTPVDPVEPGIRMRRGH